MDLNIQKQLELIQFKMDIFNMAQTYYVDNDIEDSILAEEMLQYLQADYNKIY